MINKTSGIVIAFSEKELDIAIRASLRHAANALQVAYSLQSVNLADVSTKTNVVLSFSKFVKLGVLKSPICLDETYVKNAFKMSQSLIVTQNEFENFMVVKDNPAIYYSKTFVAPIRKGLGLFLISLHSSGAITLPLNFKWPSSRNSDTSSTASKIACENSEVLSFIRSIETVAGRKQDPAFERLRNDKKRIEWFSTYATKVVLACGWNDPENLRLDDLTEVYRIQSGESTQELQGVSVFGTVIEVLGDKFGTRLNREFFDYANWTRRVALIRSSNYVDTRTAKSYGKPSIAYDDFDEVGTLSGAPVIGVRLAERTLSEDEHFLRLAKCLPAIAHPERLTKAVQLANGDFDFQGNLSYWIELQTLYMEQKRENQKAVRAALGCLNLYLFYYLPYWYICNSGISIPFPSTPDKLVGSVFVSRLLKTSSVLPKTLMEFMTEREREFQWAGNSYYNILKQIEVFFDYIIRNNSRLEHTSAFRQPLGREDYPPTQRGLGTNKVPMPRRFLSIFIAYLEAFRAYVQYVADQRINGIITDADVAKLTQFSKYTNVRDNALRIGYVPVLFVKGRTIPLWWLPGFPKVDWKPLKGGGTALLPHPHALNQIVVAVYTGLRNNHIQWLDAEKFDSYVNDDDGDYTRLFVNTDKVKKKPWLPEVNTRVISILRDQLRWRNAVDEHGFDIPQYYNNNPKTAYPKFLPLFSFSMGGVPHSDGAYTTAWQDAILGMQTFLIEIANIIDEPIPKLCKLLPPGIDFRDNDAQRKYRDFESSTEDRTTLRVVTEITPHSARAGVVSELIRFLPAALIGQYVTGQTEGTVYHYVVADSDEIKRDQAHQALRLRQLARDQHAGIVVNASDVRNPYIKAHEVNSSLARSLKVNVTETFARYGCISLSIGEMESGLDILEEIGIGHAAFNKTEICPYGNTCPPSLIRELKGIRRCAICPYAVRSIDHLPAICAKEKQAAEIIYELDKRIVAAIRDKTFTAEEIDALEEERQRIGEELAGWELCIEILELARRRIEAGEDTRRWVVERPEILTKQLQRVAVSSNTTDYLLGRLAECTSYPGFQSPRISKQFDLLRRRILAKSGASLDEVLSLEQPVDSAAECVGLIRSLAAAHKLSAADIAELMTSDDRLKQNWSRKTLRLENA